MRVLLHTCCGPCSVSVNKILRDEGYRVDSFFYNPNIHPFTEFRSRLEGLQVLFSSGKEYSPDEVIISPKYDPEEFLRLVAGNPAERCEKCYMMRMEETAKVAANGQYDAFSSTLLISPYQKHDCLVDVCRESSTKYNIPFLYKDFRPFFREGQELSKSLNLYRQKYCGCIYSEFERYKKQKDKLMGG